VRSGALQALENEVLATYVPEGSSPHCRWAALGWRT